MSHDNLIPLARHLDDFAAHLAATTNARGRKNTPGHVKTTMQRARAVVNGCRFKRLRDIAGGPVEKFLCTLAMAKRASAAPRKVSAQSRNFYLQAVSQFCEWLVTEERMPKNPLSRLRKENVEMDRRHKRRAFMLAELPWIFETTAKSNTVFRGLAGGDRVALYATALGTGFRVRELASLAPSAFDLDGVTVSVNWEFTKNRKPVKNRPIPRDLADHLRGYLAGKPIDRPIWPGSWKGKAARMVRADLAAARAAWMLQADGKRNASGFLAYQNGDGEFADFHAWRHTFISLLLAAGVNGKLTMDLARIRRRSSPSASMPIWSKRRPPRR